MKNLTITLLLACLASPAAAGEPPFPNAPEGAGAFGPIIGDHLCTMTYRGPDGALDQVAKCRWNWYYKFSNRMVQDDFYMYDDQGNVVWTGSTLRTWDLAQQRWNNMFLGVHGTGFGRMFHGVSVDNEIHLTVDGEDPDGRTHMNRIYFSDIGDGAFNWRQERSYDGGETWAVWVKTEVGPPTED